LHKLKKANTQYCWQAIETEQFKMATEPAAKHTPGTRAYESFCTPPSCSTLTLRWQTAQPGLTHT
jgi:hypothetical protein